MSKPETKKAKHAREVAERKAARKAAKSARRREVFSTPIAQAVAPIKDDAIERAEKDAREYIVRLTKTLEENDFDLDKVAPRPGVYDGQYRQKVRRRDLFQSFTKYVGEGSRSIHSTDPYTVEVDETRVERFVEQAKQAAADHYDAFVYKLVDKAGDHKSASIKGNHVWDYSILTVTDMQGNVTRWKTQQIVNCSVYGLLFNQWPSRVMKD